MNSERSLSVLFLLLGCVLFFGSGCRGKTASAPDSAEETGFSSRMDLEEDDSGIVRLKGETVPFTGSVVHRNKDWRVTYFVHYQDGKKFGPEVRFFPSGRIYRVNDYQDGKQFHQREWHENGRLILDAEMVDGTARGRHQRWHANGNVRFDGHFDENFQWDGRMLDLKEDGTVIWDAVFKAGRYVSGVYPAFMQPVLLDNGTLKPENAAYSEEEVAAALATLEAEKAREKAEEKDPLQTQPIR